MGVEFGLLDALFDEVVGELDSPLFVDGDDGRAAEGEVAFFIPLGDGAGGVGL